MSERVAVVWNPSKVDRDGGPVTEPEAHTVMVGNCGTVQGGITLMPDAEPDDGQLDLLILSGEGLGGWLDTLKTAAWDNGVLRWFKKDAGAVGGETTDHVRGAAFTMVVEKPVTFEIDGEELGEVTEVTIEVQPAALSVRG